MNKNQKYQDVIRSFKGLLEAELPFEVHLSNICSLLKKEFNFFWVGFYKRVSENELQISSYQGEVPCFSINLDKGVCGKAAKTGKTQIIDNVDDFLGYIACHPEPKSEMVVPMSIDNRVEYVLDIDHVDLSAFDSIDAQNVKLILEMLKTKLSQ